MDVTSRQSRAEAVENRGWVVGGARRGSGVDAGTVFTWSLQARTNGIYHAHVKLPSVGLTYMAAKQKECRSVGRLDVCP